MKLLSNLATLSIAANLLLQSGSFVAATPFFNIPTAATAHNNDASLDINSCDGFRVTYPFTSGISFEEESKHVVAWQAPTGMKQVNLTLVDNTLSGTPAYIGIFDASQGATDEFPLSLGDKDAGEYHFHLSGQGDNQYCEADSVPFQITKRAVDTTDETSTETEASENTNDDDSTHEDDANWDSALNKVTNLTSESNESHSNDASSTNDTKQSFADYINSLDQDYKKYLDKNKETETEDVTHKNEGEDLDPYFTNEDRTTKAHNNEPQVKTWHSNDANSYFTNEDQTTNASAYHNDSEWVTEDNVEDEEHTNAANWESEDVDVEDESSTIHANFAEWQDDNEEHSNAATEWVSEDNEEHTNAANWESEDVDLEDDHVNSAEWSDDAHENLSEWYSDDAQHNNDWSSEEVDVAHANEYMGDVDYDQDLEEEDTTEHNNGWVSEEDEHLNAAGWSTEEVDIVDHPNYHPNDVEWTSGDEHTNAANWESEDVDVEGESSAIHANFAEWQDDNEEHSNAATEWVSEDNEEHTNAANWESEDVDVEGESSAIHANFAEWQDDNEEHNNAATEWISEDIDTIDHSDYHTNDSEWVSEDEEHTNAGWVSEDIEHDDYYIRSGDWDSYDAESTKDTEWQDDNEEHTNAAPEWISEEMNDLDDHVNSNEWESEDHINATEELQQANRNDHIPEETSLLQDDFVHNNFNTHHSNAVSDKEWVGL